MQGFSNLANDIGYGIAVALPALCYIFGGFILLHAIYGFWKTSKDGGGKPFLPFIEIAISATLLSFQTMLTALNKTFGFTTTVTTSGVGEDPATAVDATSLIGASPSATLLNIIKLFDTYFMAYGALVVFLAILHWRARAAGTSDGSHGGELVKICFGVAMMNVSPLASIITSEFPS